MKNTYKIILGSAFAIAIIGGAMEGLRQTLR